MPTFAHMVCENTLEQGQTQNYIDRQNGGKNSNDSLSESQQNNSGSDISILKIPTLKTFVAQNTDASDEVIVCKKESSLEYGSMTAAKAKPRHRT